MGKQREWLINRNKNHKTVFSDSLALTQSCHSERTLIFDMDALAKVSLDKVMEIYHDRFNNPGDFTFLFVGDINPNDKAVQKAVCQWIGGLKTKKAEPEKWHDWNIHAPQGMVKNYFTREMEIHQTTNRIQYTSDEIPYTLENEVIMELIGRILGTRYLESIREREGGSYGVGCAGWVTRIPYASARLVMQFDTDPEKEERLMQVIHEEVQTIVKDGPLAQDLQKEKESMLKDYQENLQKNWWWRSAVYDKYVYGDDLLADYEKTVQGITAEKIQALLARLVAAGNVFEVVMSPAQ
jgi:zinc protease